MSWKITTSQKKSIIEHDVFTNNGRSIIRSIGWRWGWVVVSEDPQIEDPENNDTLIVSDLDVDDHCYDDGCWEEWDFGDLTEEEIGNILQAWEDDWQDGLEQLGWSHYETEVVFRGPLEIEKLDDEEEPVQEQPAPSKGWSF